MSGLPSTQASVFAAVTPMSSDPINPGRCATAIASTSAEAAGQFRLLDRFSNNRNDVFDMRPAGDLRHHAAIFRMQSILRGDDIRLHVKTIDDDRRRRFVAGGFDTENNRHL